MRYLIDTETGEVIDEIEDDTIRIEPGAGVTVIEAEDERSGT